MTPEHSTKGGAMGRYSSDEHRWHATNPRSEEHTSELQSRQYLVCRLLLEKKNKSRPFIVTHTHAIFFVNDTAPTEIYALSLPDALPISGARAGSWPGTCHPTCRSPA